jgi:hypothetical protein
VMARGNERREIFRDDEDRRRFLEALGDGVHAVRLANPRLLLDAQSLSRTDRHTAGQPGSGDGLVADDGDGD